MKMTRREAAQHAARARWSREGTRSILSLKNLTASQRQAIEVIVRGPADVDVDQLLAGVARLRETRYRLDEVIAAYLDALDDVRKALPR